MAFTHTYTIIVALVVLANGAALKKKDEVTPLEKVTELLTDLKMEVENMGRTEATSYNEFACFCKTNTQTKSDSIVAAQDDVDLQTSDIGFDTASKESKEDLRLEAKTLKETKFAALQKATETFNTEKTAHEAKDAELAKAVLSCTNALSAIANPVTPPATSGNGPLLLQKKSNQKTSFLSLASPDMKYVLDLADALGLMHARRQRAVSTLLQSKKVDPNDPEYKEHSSEIVGIIGGLKGDFEKSKRDGITEFGKTQGAYDSEKASMDAVISKATVDIGTYSYDIEALKQKIGTASNALISSKAELTEDSEYLKELTMRCQQKGKDYDQRTKMRSSEVTAITKAVALLEGAVANTEHVNVRAASSLIQEDDATSKQEAAEAMLAEFQKKNRELAKKVYDQQAQDEAAELQAPKAPSFIQTRRFFSKAKRVQTATGKIQHRAAELLRAEGVRLQSKALSSLAAQFMADPFSKVKTLIMGLTERLLEEAKQEATKTGFCNTELGKSKATRDARFSETQKLAAELGALQARRSVLELSVSEDTATLGTLNATLNSSIEDRAENKEESEETLKDAKEGVKALGEALAMLKTFYSSAAKTSLLQISASPIDNDLFNSKPAACTGGTACAAVTVLDDDGATCIAADAVAGVAAVARVAACTFTPALALVKPTCVAINTAAADAAKTADDIACGKVTGALLLNATHCGDVMTTAVHARARIACTYSAATAAAHTGTTSAAGFKGLYKGSQDASKAIIGLLQTIHSDFMRTIRTTEAAEKTEAAEAVKFDRTILANTASKTKKVELEDEDLDSVKIAITNALEDMRSAQALVDGALRNIATMSPACIDTGMSYTDRVAKRDAEIAALERANTMLAEADATENN